MNKILLVLFATLLVSACEQDADQSTVETDKTTTTISEQDKMAYAIGTNMADSILDINSKYESLGMKNDVVKRGFIDAMAGQSKLTEDETKAQFQIFQQKIMFAQQQQMQQSQQSKSKENEAYLTANLTKGFTKTESGLQYKVVQAAKKGAAQPSATDTVLVHYTGTLTDGTQFDSSVGKDRGPFKFSLKGGVIDGWLEGVKLMSVGSKYQFVIPPELGYRSQNSGPIPANSILIFDIELLEIVKAEDTKK